MSSRRRRLAFAASSVFCLAAPLWGPPLLRRMPLFDVERVEVSGTRLLAPHEVLTAAGIRSGESIWDDPGAWEEALRRHPVVADAQITRELLGTLRIRVEEQRPVALVEAGILRLATAAGEVLPVDPARAPVDLPLLRTGLGATGESQVQDTAARMLLAETDRLGALDPGLVAQISELRRSEAGELLLTLSHPAVEVLLPRGAESVRLHQLRAVLAHIERQNSAPAGAARQAAPLRVDLRFEDQIVVRSSSSD